MHMSLVISLSRCRTADPQVAALAFAGQLEDALRLAVQRVARESPDGGRTSSLRAQMMGRILLALGREEEAQEHFQAALRQYDTVSRGWVRWSSSLDQGWTFIAMDRPGRAIECFRVLVEDADAPADMVLEAMHGAADALMSLGESQRAMNLVDSSLAHCESAGLTELQGLAQCHRLELQVLQATRSVEELSDHALANGFREPVPGQLAPDELRRQLTQREREMQELPLVVQRLQMLQLTLTCVHDRAGAVERFTECLVWLKERRLAGLEAGARVQAAIALLARGSGHAARDALAAMARPEPQAGTRRYSMDVQYCLSKLYLLQGQMSDSMRAYKQHVEEAVYVIKRDLAQARRIAAGRHGAPEAGDAARLRLPLKYRGAYQFIVEHLGDPDLSVKVVAAQAGVTERSLQMAFRTHLGLSPAELIRRQRMERIHEELQSSDASSRANVQEVASRWGVSNRSTLAHSYRQLYAESPSQTRQGVQRER